MSDPQQSRPTRILLFGASSAVGGYLLPLLLARGRSISAVTRQDPTQLRARFPAIAWSQAALPDAPAADVAVTHVLSLGPCDAFVDWLTRQPPGGALRQIIAFGSTSADTKADSPSDRERALAASLRRSEARLAQECTRLNATWTLLRPTLIYGAGTDLVARIGDFAARWHIYPRPLGTIGRARRQPVHAQDLAIATLGSIDTLAAANQRFDLAGDEVLALAALIARAARTRTRFAWPLPLPIGLLLRSGSALGLLESRSGLDAAGAGRLAQDQVFDTVPARQALGFAPRRFEP